MNDFERHDLDAALRSSAHVYTDAVDADLLGRPDKADLLRRSRARKQQRIVAASVAVVAVVAVAGLTTRLGTTSNLETGIADQPGSTAPGTTATVSTAGGGTVRTTIPSPTGTTPASATTPTTITASTTSSVSSTSAVSSTTTAPGDEPATAAGTVVATVDLYPRDLNAAGDILGVAKVDGVDRPVVWMRATGVLRPIALPDIDPTAFNDDDWVVGTSQLRGPNRGVRWMPTQADVRIVPGPTSDARDINEAGHVVGHVGGRAYIWADLGPAELPLPDGATASYATAINERDEVVGYLELADGRQHAFFWSTTTGTVDLGTLGGKLSIAADINDDGTVVGNAQAVNDGPMRLFTWTAAGGMVDLGTLGQSSQAVAINNSGTIVGNWFDGSDPNFRRGFIYTASTGMHDIDAAPRDHSALALGLNDAGQVLIADDHALLWEPAAG